MFREWLSANRAVIVARAQHATAETSCEPVADTGVAQLFDHIVEALAPAPDDSTTGGAATARHGGERSRSGAPLARLVHEHGKLVRAALEVADEQGVWLGPGELRELLEAFDSTLAAAVSDHQRACDRSQDEERADRLKHFSHELRNKLYTVTLAWSVLKGRKGEAGDESTAVVDRNLTSLVNFIDASLAELRDDRGQRDCGRVIVLELVDELALELSPEAAPRKLRFEVAPIPADLAVEASWAVLAETLGRLLHSAFRCSREGGRVSLRAKASGDRVLIEVEDESGGLGSANAHAVLAAVASRGAAPGAPPQQGTIEAYGGKVDLYDLPGKGCIVTLSLPRAAGT